MKRLTRREVFGSIGIAGASFVLSSCLGEQSKQAVVSPAGEGPKFPWPYARLDPDYTAERVYYSTYRKGCMHNVFKSIVSQLADVIGQPYRFFPFEMMSYGSGGISGWGGPCGSLNGAAAVICLFAKEGRVSMDRSSELLAWYEKTALPVYVPKEPEPQMEIPAAVSHSILCHVSISNWCKVSGYKVASKERGERCRRMTADIAGKTVELLNSAYEGEFTAGEYLSEEVKKCRSCHAKGGELENTKGKMYCGSCHFSLASEHPPLDNNRP
ncbi:MAG: C-GCAxxG-C-C family (seleno)protein [Planctomycetota bacterium]